MTIQRASLRLSALSLGLAMAGCALVPGSHLTYRSSEVVEESPEQAAVQLPIQVMPITPGLVQSLEGQQQSGGVMSPEANEQLARDLENYVYYIGKGDVLTVAVLDNPEFTSTLSAGAAPAISLPGAAAGGAAAGVLFETPAPQVASRGTQVQVQRDGSIFLAFAGKLSVMGKTVPEVREMVTRALSRFIRNPQVDVTVQSFQSQRVYVTGDIGKSGSLPVTTEPLTLFDAVTRIGLASTPDLEKVTLVRDRQPRVFSLERLFKLGDASQNILLRHGDVLNFQRNNDRAVYVLGEVGSTQGGAMVGANKAGRVPIGFSGLTLGEALAQAGGISQLTARPTGVFVMRGVEDELGQRRVDIYQLDASNATAYVLADRFTLQPRDFVYVTAAPVVRFNRVMSQIVPFASSFLLFGAAR